jgi:hypothetical protein
MRRNRANRYTRFVLDFSSASTYCLSVKFKATVSIEREVWDRSKKFFESNPQIGSISAFFELALESLMDTLEPVMQRARSGDKEAALFLLEHSFITRSHEATEGILGLRTLVKDSEVKKAPSKAKKKASR